MNLDKLLNPEQLAAVMHPGGPMMIIAGAGSGKTRVLTYRIAKLLLDGEDAFRILALTFTNKAAREMKERIAQVVGESEAQNIWMGTFHSVFAKILRREADRLGYPSSFTIYDQEDSQKLIRNIIKEMNLDPEIYKPKQIASRISIMKNSLITPRVYRKTIELMEQDMLAKRPEFLQIYINYNDRLFRASAMDFDDLLLKTNELLAKHPDVLMKYQRQFKHILVDEYQDTNHSQYLIVRALGDYYRNIAVVGDDSQSIYSFRGANIQNILNFQKDYPDAAVYKLEQNYRSTKNIVGAGNSLIKHNRIRLEKTLWTGNEEGEKVSVVGAYSDSDEARSIAEDIAETRQRYHLHYKDFAILYRTNSQSRALESALRTYNIPYRIYGGLSFYQRKEIKDVLAYLRLIVNEKDEEALRRIINFPSRKIGQVTMDKLNVLAGRHRLSLFETIEKIDELGAGILNGPTRLRLKNFAVKIRSFQVLSAKVNVYELTKELIKSVKLLEEYRKEGTQEAANRIENIEELINAMAEFIEDQTQLADGDPSLTGFLQHVALLTDLDQDKDNQNVVTLMTVHMSKGLEFPYVYVSGLEENLFPSALSMTSREDLEEERRLLYVAITRAKKRCTLTYARMRYRWGSLYDTEPSRFIDEIDEKFLDRKDLISKTPDYLHADIFDDSPSRPASTSSFKAKSGFSKTIRPKNFKPLSEAKKSTSSIDLKLSEGDRVRHAKFGKGTVMEISGKGDNRQAKVRFDHTGTKTLILRFAKLEIIK